MDIKQMEADLNAEKSQLESKVSDAQKTISDLRAEMKMNKEELRKVQLLLNAMNRKARVNQAPAAQ